MTPQETWEKKRVETGVVIDAGKTPKTIKVQRVRLVRHSHYRKYMKKRKNFLVHDEHGKAQLGDTVRIIESSPISKNKCWRLVEIVRQAATSLPAGKEGSRA